MKATKKTTELKRLSIYLILAFAIAWIPEIILNKTVGYHEWFESGKMPFFAFFIFFAPALANIITRLLSKEGMKNSLLSFKPEGRLKYYLLAIFLVTVLRSFDSIFVTIVFGKLNLSKSALAGPLKIYLPGMLISYAQALIMSFISFGEEFGWRGYMIPKISGLLGKPLAMILGGVIWGLWYAPLTIAGHNFGRSYAGFPYTGILLMCLICTIMGIFLMWLTERSGSIYPACIMHAMFNHGPDTIPAFLTRGLTADFERTMRTQVISLLPSLLLSAILAVYFLKNPAKKQDP